MIKAVIFDIDGTLIDSNAAHAETFVKAFAEYDKKVSFEEIKKLIGMGSDKILEKYLSKSEIEEFGDDLTEYRKKIFLENYLPEIKTFPKLHELLKKIKANGKKIVLASSAGDEELEKYKKLMKIDEFLEEETSSDDAEESKPAPDIFQAAFDKLKNVEKTEVLIIGDTPYDAEAAKKAGIKIYGVESGGWSRENLLEKGCEKVFLDIAEIYRNYKTIFETGKSGK